jgi:hypothetical protein
MLWNLSEQNMVELWKENSEFPALDPTTPWFEFLSYQECCWSLNRPVRLGAFMRYNAYLKEIGLE